MTPPWERGEGADAASGDGGKGGVTHLVMKHGVPWRGVYARALRLSPIGIETLAANEEVTNTWRWEHVREAARVPGHPKQFTLHIAAFATQQAPGSPPAPPATAATADCQTADAATGPPAAEGRPSSRQPSSRQPSSSQPSSSHALALADGLASADELGPLGCLVSPFESGLAAWASGWTSGWTVTLKFEAADERACGRVIAQVVTALAWWRQGKR